MDRELLPWAHKLGAAGRAVTPPKNEKMSIFGQKVDAVCRAKINPTIFTCKRCILLDDYTYYFIDGYRCFFQFNLTS